MIVFVKLKDFIKHEYITFKCSSTKQLKFKVLNVYKLSIDNIDSIRVMDLKKGTQQDYKGKDLMKI